MFITAAPVGDGFALVLSIVGASAELAVVDEDGGIHTLVDATHAGTEAVRSAIGSRRGCRGWHRTDCPSAAS